MDSPSKPTVHLNTQENCPENIPKPAGYFNWLCNTQESYHESTNVCSLPLCCSAQLSTGMGLTNTIGARLIITIAGASKAHHYRPWCKIARGGWCTACCWCTEPWCTACWCTAVLTFQGGECCHQHVASCLSQPQDPPLSWWLSLRYNAEHSSELTPPEEGGGVGH